MDPCQAWTEREFSFDLKDSGPRDLRLAKLLSSPGMVDEGAVAASDVSTNTLIEGLTCVFSARMPSAATGLEEWSPASAAERSAKALLPLVEVDEEEEEAAEVSEA